MRYVSNRIYQNVLTTLLILITFEVHRKGVLNKNNAENIPFSVGNCNNI